MFIGDIKKALLKEFVISNNLTPELNFADVIFDDAYESISSDCNAAINFTVKANNVNYKGTQRLRYNRHSLATVYREIIIVDNTVSFSNTLELVEYLIEVLGLPLDQTVFKNTVISADSDDVVLEVVSSNRYLPNTTTTVIFRK